MRYHVIQLFINTGVVEATSTDSVILNELITFLRTQLEVSVNKIEIRNVRGKTLNVRIFDLAGPDAFNIFWALLDHILQLGWEPFGTLSDTISFKHLSNED